MNAYPLRREGLSPVVRSFCRLPAMASIAVLLFLCATTSAAADRATAAKERKAARQATREKKLKKQDASEAVFATNAPIHTFHVEVSAPELAALQKNVRAYVRANVRVGSEVFTNVGVHLKGNGSFRPLNDKPSLVIKFDHFVPRQEFSGLGRIALNNASQDPTFLADFIANSMFADAGVPVSRVTHARVKFNERDLGLYVLVEAQNKEFLKRSFRNSAGNLYEAYLQDVDQKMDQDHGSDMTQADRQRLAEVTKIANAAERWPKLHEVLDVDRYVSHLVCELFTSHVDGYAYSRNNYRIYGNADTGRFTFIGHGVDWAFQNSGVSIRPPMGSLVTRAVLTTMPGARLFRERFGTLFTNVFDLGVLTNRVNAAVGRLVADARSTNEVKQFQGYGAEMNRRLVARRQNITNQLYAPPAITLSFNDRGMARLNDWKTKTDKSSPPVTHEKGTEASRRFLRVSASGNSSNAMHVGSWRMKVLLAPGKYVFEGDLRAAGIVSKTNDLGLGAGLRISGGKRPNNKLEGNAPWTHVEYPIQIEGLENEVELVCELRALKGEVWFDADSLRLRRLPEVSATSSNK
jgi:spore coat protein CotH